MWVSPGTSAAIFLCSLPRGEAIAQRGSGPGGGAGAAALRGPGCPPAEHHLAEGGAQRPCRRVRGRRTEGAWGPPSSPGACRRPRQPRPLCTSGPPASFHHPAPETVPKHSAAGLGGRGGDSPCSLCPPPPCEHSGSPAPWSDSNQATSYPPSLLGGPGPKPPAPGLLPPNPGGHSQVLPGGQLRIVGVSPKDAGSYFCIAQNSAGSAVGKTRLVVQGGPRAVPRWRDELGAARLLRAPPFAAGL